MNKENPKFWKSPSRSSKLFVKYSLALYNVRICALISVPVVSFSNNVDFVKQFRFTKHQETLQPTFNISAFIVLAYQVSNLFLYAQRWLFALGNFSNELDQFEE